MQTNAAVEAAFLCQSLEDCWFDWRRACSNPAQAAWSDVVVTASNEAQADSIRVQIENRAARAMLPGQTRFHVIPDPGGKRVGSGGATLNLIRELRGTGGFGSRRVLVIHSGGDSKRVPQYSAIGKLFSPVPRELPDGRVSTLFDELLISLAGVPARMPPGMLTLCGDVLLLFNALQIDLEWTRAACLTAQVPAEQGVKHGVFLGDEHGIVRRFLHKQSADSLRAMGAVNASGRVCLDTGAVWLHASVVDGLASLVASDESFARFVNDTARLSFYGDFLYPMAGEATLESYLAQAPEGASSPLLDECRRALWGILHPVRMKMIRLSPARFIHFGTTSELRGLMMGAEQEYGCIGWERHIQSAGVPGHSAAILSQTDDPCAIGEGCYLENARVTASVSIGSGCVLSGVTLDTGSVPPDTVMHALPLTDGRFVCRVYGVYDNPKEGWRKGMFARFPDCGVPDGVSLWDAPLYPVCGSPDEAVRAAVNLLETLTSRGEAAYDAWASSERVSLAESFARADTRAILSGQERTEDTLRVKRAIETLCDGKGFDAAVERLSPHGPLRARQISLLDAAAADAAYPLGASLNRMLYRLTDAAVYEDRCYKSINDHIYRAVLPSLPSAADIRIARDAAEVTLPARVNFGGGWSDTPPYSIDHCGTVLNAAVLPNGLRPLKAWARRIPEPCVLLEVAVPDAVEPGGGLRSQTYDSLEALRLTGDPSDPFALGKAALAAAGVIRGGTGAVPAERWGGGFALGVASELPKGSGLGGSSILAAAAIRAVSRLFGLPDDDATVLDRTVLAEQIMSTGGGWQDQAGALLPGVKLITAPPGDALRLNARALALNGETRAALDARLSLVYTGQRRLARNILREITGKVIDREPVAMRVLEDIQRLAAMMAFELERGDLPRFGALLNRHWELSRELDPDSTNRCIDLIVSLCADLTDGVMICGAGGGGFLTVLRKDGVSRDRLADRLSASFQDSGIEVWDCRVDYVD